MGASPAESARAHWANIKLYIVTMKQLPTKSFLPGPIFCRIPRIVETTTSAFRGIFNSCTFLNICMRLSGSLSSLCKKNLHPIIVPICFWIFQYFLFGFVPEPLYNLRLFVGRYFIRVIIKQQVNHCAGDAYSTDVGAQKLMRRKVKIRSANG